MACACPESGGSPSCRGVEDGRRVSNGRTPRRPRTASWLPLLIGALFIGSGYGLVIGAMRVIPAAYAVALSNLGIVVAAFLSVVVFREREHVAQRLIWASVLAASLMLIEKPV